MVGLVFSIIFFIVAVIAVGVFMTSEDARLPAGIAAVVCVIFGAVILLFSCYDRVDTRNVGIVTAFGRPVGVHGAGIVWHAPWKNVSELSEAIQLQAFESNSYDDAAQGKGANGNPSAIGVRLANNSNAYVDENLNWRIKEGAAAKMFQDYGGGDVFDTIKQQLVDRQAQVALSEVFAQFNPQTLLTTQAVVPGAPDQQPAAMQGADLPKMAEQVKHALIAKVCPTAANCEIEILDVRIPRIFYEGKTQDRIDDYNKKVQETLNAAQDVKTAEQLKDAATKRAEQPVPDLRIAISNCVNQAAADKRDAAGCFGQIGGQPLIQIPH